MVNFEPLTITVAPNPFVDGTGIRFTLATAQAGMRVGVYDVGGRLVRNLFAGSLGAGSHEYRLDGSDASGRRALDGIYFIRVQGPGFRLLTKVVRLQ